MLSVNQSIPEFSAEAFHNGDFRTITTNDVKGKWSIFLFYPADFSFVCPTELADMQTQYAMLQKLDVEVYAVSTDSHTSHKSWHETNAAIRTVEYPMIGDQTGQVSQGFGVLTEKGDAALRGTFLVNPEGIVKVCEIHDIGIGRSTKDIIRKVLSAQYVSEHGGEVCLTAWGQKQIAMIPNIDLIGPDRG